MSVSPWIQRTKDKGWGWSFRLSLTPSTRSATAMMLSKHGLNEWVSEWVSEILPSPGTSRPTVDIRRLRVLGLKWNGIDFLSYAESMVPYSPPCHVHKDKLRCLKDILPWAMRSLSLPGPSSLLVTPMYINKVVRPWGSWNIRAIGASTIDSSHLLIYRWGDWGSEREGAEVVKL